MGRRTATAGRSRPSTGPRPRSSGRAWGCAAAIIGQRRTADTRSRKPEKRLVRVPPAACPRPHLAFPPGPGQIPAPASCTGSPAPAALRAPAGAAARAASPTSPPSRAPWRTPQSFGSPGPQWNLADAQPAGTSGSGSSGGRQETALAWRRSGRSRAGTVTAGRRLRAAGSAWAGPPPGGLGDSGAFPRRAGVSAGASWAAPYCLRCR